jgi:hypothetical protein
MENERNADNRSPWPACADCHIGEEEPSATNADKPEPRDAAAIDGEDGWDQLEHMADLGPRRDEVQRQACEAYARAIERARMRIEPGK